MFLTSFIIFSSHQTRLINKNAKNVFQIECAQLKVYLTPFSIFPFWILNKLFPHFFNFWDANCFKVFLLKTSFRRYHQHKKCQLPFMFLSPISLCRMPWPFRQLLLNWPSGCIKWRFGVFNLIFLLLRIPILVGCILQLMSGWECLSQVSIAIWERSH